jgi:hypothetical protein
MLSGEFLEKAPPKDCMERNRAKFIRAMAILEIELPAFWQVITHHLLSHEDKQAAMFGSFWCQNMLCIERFHVPLKSMARGSRNLMSSIDTHYNLFDAAHTEWRGDETNTWANAPRHSSLAADRYENIIIYMLCIIHYIYHIIIYHLLLNY